MLLSKIPIRKSNEMDRHKFYQNLRNGAREAKRANSQRTTTTTADDPKPLATSGRKTTRFDTTNLDDDEPSVPRYNSEDSTKISVGDPHTSRQQSMRDKSFHETIYSPRTDRRGRPQESVVMSPRAEGGFLGGRGNETRSARRERSQSKEKIEEFSPVLVGEDSKNRLTTENKLLKIEMDDVNNQLEVLKNDQENAVHRLNEVRRELERAHRDHTKEVEELREKLRELQVDKADLMNELDKEKKKKELLRLENDRLKSEFEQFKDAVEYNKKSAQTSNKVTKDIERLEEELERKSKLLDKLMGDNEALKQQEKNLAKDRELEDRLGRMTSKLDRKREKLAAARNDIENLRKAVFSAEQEAELRAKIDKLASALKGKDLLLEETKRERRTAQLEKEEMENKCRELKDQFISLHSQMSSVQKTNKDINNEIKELESENSRLKDDNEKLKEQVREEKDNALKVLRFSALEEKVNPLKESIREKDLKIADLEKEVDTLRHAVQGYQKQIDVLRTDQELPPPPPVPDHASAHRRLLEENTRLLSMVDQYRRMVQAPPDLSRTKSHNGELEDAKRHLRASEDRVAQLEKWLDQIYNDKDFDVILKGQGKGQRVQVLPDLPKRYILARGPTDVEKKIKPGYFTERPQ